MSPVVALIYLCEVDRGLSFKFIRTEIHYLLLLKVLFKLKESSNDACFKKKSFGINF